MSAYSDDQQKTDDMCSNFARAVIVTTEPMLTDQLQQIQPSVSSMNLVPQNVKEDSPTFKEQTLVEQSSVHEEKVAHSGIARVPDVVKNKTGVQVDASSLEARIEKVCKDVRGLLNKITPSTYADLSVEMINKAVGKVSGSVWKDPETLPTVVELIFIKAVEEPTFVKIYSDLCSSLHKAEQNMEKENFQRHFHGAIIRKLQRTFEAIAHSQYQKSAGMLEKQIEEEQSKEEKDDKKIADLNEQLDEMKAKEKRRMICTIKFISHLFRIGLLNYKIIENCIVILIRNAVQTKSELMAEYAVEMIKHVGPHTSHKKEDESKIDGYVSYLETFIKPTVSNRVKFMIIDLVELRDNKWVRKADGPKTMEENMFGDFEKTAADQKKKSINAVDKNPRYQGPPSIDKKDRLAAALNASHTTGSNLKKDTSKFENQHASVFSSASVNIAPENAKAQTPVEQITLSETSDQQLKKDDMCSDFARAVIVTAEPMLTDQLQEIHPSVASPASVNLVPENGKEETPVELSPVPEEKMASSIVLEQLHPETSDADKEKAEFEAVSRMDRPSLIHHYENKLGDFIAVPQNLQEIGSKTYSRSLIQIMRDVIRNIHTVPCPLSEDILKLVGIDRATVTSSTSPEVRRPLYNPRHKGKQLKANFPSILTRFDNASVPDVVKNKTGVRVDASSLVARIEKPGKDVCDLLDKLTPSNYAELSMEIVNKAVWKDPETLPSVVEHVFKKVH